MGLHDKKRSPMFIFHCHNLSFPTFSFVVKAVIINSFTAQRPAI